jgi:hypothetical protein
MARTVVLSGRSLVLPGDGGVGDIDERDLAQAFARTIGVRELRSNVTGTSQGRTLVYFTAITHSLAFNGKGTP